MDYRTLGRTGTKVSPLCLGAMMFGAWGNPDHDESIRIIHRALDAGINFIDTADVYSAGESEEIVGKALQGGRRDDVILATKAHGAMGRDRNMRGNSRRWLVREVESRLPRPGHRARGDAGGADRPRPRREDPRLRQLDVSGARDRRRAVDRAHARPRPVRHRAAAVLDARTRHRARRAPGGRAVRDGGAA